MDTNDRQAIETLFDKLATVEQQAPQRDAEADRFIREKIARQPGAPYYMAQTIVVQERALEAAQHRIDELERQAQAQPPSSGGSLFGADRSEPRRPAGSVPRTGNSSLASGESKWGAGSLAAGSADQSGFGTGRSATGMGGGFLAGAAQTAMGVAGGVLLGNAIAGMFGGGEAKAAEAPAETAAEPQSGHDDPPVEDASYDDADLDDGAGFDDGGDFEDI